MEKDPGRVLVFFEVRRKLEVSHLLTGGLLDMAGHGGVVVEA